MTVAKPIPTLLLRPILTGKKQRDESIVAITALGSLWFVTSHTRLYEGVYSASVFHPSEIGSRIKGGRWPAKCGKRVTFPPTPLGTAGEKERKEETFFRTLRWIWLRVSSIRRSRRTSRTRNGHMADFTASSKSFWFFWTSSRILCACCTLAWCTIAFWYSTLICETASIFSTRTWIKRSYDHLKATQYTSASFLNFNIHKLIHCG